MTKAGFSREVITPPRGMSLAGYFNPRPNIGVLDDLYVKVLLLEHDSTVTGLVVFDLCFVTAEIIKGIKRKIAASGLDFGDNLIFSATHTHTGPQVAKKFFGTSPDSSYLDLLQHRTVSAIAQALANLLPAEISAGNINDNPFAYNRRYWMKNGAVLTNPGKLNPDIVKPESTVDSEISIMSVKQNGIIIAVVANIVNHTDTIGGDWVSADWPGRMEREIQNITGHDIPVLTLIGCSGNINHFDVFRNIPQSRYGEACRIGIGYASIIASQLYSLKAVTFDKITVQTEDFIIPFRKISEAEIKKAKAVLAKESVVCDNKDLTSEGLATGEGPVARFFAEQMIAYNKICSGKKRTFKLITIKLGDQLIFASLPGEPFTEIGLELKKRSPFKYNFMISLAMGSCGYVPMPECFSRGGYEILPVVNGGPREDTAPRLIEALTNMMA
ncbi:MAG: hypothetical protein WC071_05070 [Victivallaceae bacterium]